MIVVSDTSCVSNLLTIGHADLLTQLFGEVVIPPAVLRELHRFHFDLPAFLRVVRSQDAAMRQRLMELLDEGEAEAICLACELKADRLLIDEKLGRAVAIREGVSVIGVVGVLVTAKKSNLLPKVGPLLARLESEAGFRLSPEIKVAALKAVGEAP